MDSDLETSSTKEADPLLCRAHSSGLWGLGRAQFFSGLELESQGPDQTPVRPVLGVTEPFHPVF